MKTHKQSAVALSVCTTLAVAMGAAQANTSIDQSPFAMQDLGTGFMLAASHEGKCGEGKCGGNKGKKEGKCGEGKCGMSKMDSNSDGSVTKDEFMSGHEKMFADKDKNGDGMLDAGEMKMMEGKCGEGKCGASKGKKEGKCGEGKCGGKK